MKIDESRQVGGATLGEITENLKLSRQLAAEAAAAQGELDGFRIEAAFDNAGDPWRILGVREQFAVRGGVASDGKRVGRTSEETMVEVAGFGG
jgi:hypothetical protein